MQDFRFNRYRDEALAQVLTAEVMPTLPVSERTQTTYAIGANAMLKQLAGGEWSWSSRNPEHSKQLLEEFLGRVVSNAREQGIELDLGSTATTEAS